MSTANRSASWPWVTAWIAPHARPISCVRAPASSSARRGSLSSLCSTPSVARIATVRPSKRLAIVSFLRIRSLSSVLSRSAGRPNTDRPRLHGGAAGPLPAWRATLQARGSPRRGSRPPALRDCATSPTPSRASPGGAPARAAPTAGPATSRSATRRDRADQGARDPAGLDRRLDLPVGQRPHPGHRPGRPRPQAVPLPPALARGARREQVRPADRVRPTLPAIRAARRRRPARAAGCRARRCSPRSCGCSTTP